MFRTSRLRGPLWLAALLLAACGGSKPPSSAVLEPVPAARISDGPGKDGEAVLNLYSWADYVAPDTIATFERETGIKVNYTTYENDQTLEAKMLLGSSDYDVVLPSGPYFARMLKIGAYHRLDKSALPNYKNLDPEILTRMAQYDPGNQYAVPYLWSSTGLAYDAVQARKRFGNRIADSWSLLLDPAAASKFADCGIAIVDSPTEVFSIALLYLGDDPRNLDPGHLAKASALLEKIRPYIRYINSREPMYDMGNGSICMALTWSGDAVTADEMLKAAGKKAELVFTIPREGGLMAIDMMAIPATAPHPRNAHAWFNYTMRPDVIAKISNQVKYPNGNSASTGMVRDELRANPAIYPDASTLNRMTSSIAASPEASLIVRREWARFKANYR